MSNGPNGPGENDAVQPAERHFFCRRTGKFTQNARLEPETVSTARYCTYWIVRSFGDSDVLRNLLRRTDIVFIQDQRFAFCAAPAYRQSRRDIRLGRLAGEQNMSSPKPAFSLKNVLKSPGHWRFEPKGDFVG